MRGWICCLLTLLLGALPANAGEVVTTTGQTLTGPVAWRGGELVISAAEGERKVPLAEVRTAKFDTPEQSMAANGLLGEYFEGGDLAPENLRAAVVDPQLDFTWGTSSPMEGVPPDFSARWSGTLRAPVSGEYTIEFEVDDGVRLWIDGQQIAERWSMGVTPVSGKVKLEAGKSVPIRVEYYDGGSGAALKMYWSAEGVPRQIVPTASLQPQTATKPPAPETDEQRRMPKGVAAVFSQSNEWEPTWQVVRTYPSIDFNWGKAVPDPLAAKSFSVRITGQLRAKYTGRHTFAATAQQDIKLRVGVEDMLLGRDRNGAVRLEAGQLYPFELTMRRGAEEAGSVRLRWSSPDLRPEIIPPDYFYLPKEQGNGGATESQSAVAVEYFSDLTFGQPCGFARLPALNYSVQHPPKGAPDKHSARFLTRLRVDQAETYTLHTRHDDGLRLWVDEKLVIDAPNHSAHTEAKVRLEQGLRTIRAEISNSGGGPTALVVEWSSPSITRQLIPATHFLPAGEDDGSGITGLSLTSPVANQVAPASKPLLLEAAVNAAKAPAAVEFRVDDRVVGADSEAPFRHELNAPAPGQHRVVALARGKAGELLAISDTLPVRVIDDRGLPQGWFVVGPEGDATSKATMSDATAATLSIAGGNLFTETDTATLLLRPVEGDVQFVARLAELSGGAPQALTAVGITLRESVDLEARHVSLTTQGASAMAAVQRTVRGDSPTFKNHSAAGVGSWLRVSRLGNRVSLAISGDGKAWETVETAETDLPRQMYVGLVAAAQEPGSAIEARFDQMAIGDIDVTPQVPAGVTLIDGSLLAGQATVTPDGTVSLKREGSELNIAADQVARITRRPHAADASPADAVVGVVLDGGDVVEGEVSFEPDGGLLVASIILGPMRFDGNEWQQVVLRSVQRSDEAAASAPHHLRLVDGSTLHVSSMSVEGDKLRLAMTSGISLEVPTGQISMIERGG